MSTVTRYNALFESLRSRRRRPLQPKGLDVLYVIAQTKIKAWAQTLSYLRREAEQIDRLAPDLRTHSDAALNEAVRECREAMLRGRDDKELVRRSFACVREVARRETGEQAYVVQLMGALALYHGRIVQMLTGEGKTLTGSLVAPILAWRHRYVHIFTVNDYLAQRDAESRACIYRRCGCDVGAITQPMQEAERFEVYAKPICYGTPKQITADWLRDQLRLGQLFTPWAGRRLLGSPGMGSPTQAMAGSGPMIPGLRAAMVDEADAVLIDEGVVPLIIARSRREDDMAQIYKDAGFVAGKLDDQVDYTIDHMRRKAELTRRGRHRTSELAAGLEEAIWRATRRAEELVRQALVAKHCYLNGNHYQIVDGRVVIVDEYTGRFLADRSWEHGLHQAVEAKEGVEITADRETLARMSFQRFFRSYPFLCGMTGTAADASAEMERVYQRPISVIPTNRPVIRDRMPLRIFATADAKWDAIVESIQQIHAKRRPILVGTRSIEASEQLSQRLLARGLPHRTLNANFDKEEADFVSLAGKHSAITVATNMAGRGTDIKLDEDGLKAGGLHVILTEMHTARRVDRQFIGRAGRQGDPGSAQMFVALEDELIRLYAHGLGSPLRAALRQVSPELTGASFIQAKALFAYCQRRAEHRARVSRTEVLRQDDWIDKHLPGM